MEPRATVLQIGALSPALEARLRAQYTVLQAHSTDAAMPLPAAAP